MRIKTMILNAVIGVLAFLLCLTGGFCIVEFMTSNRPYITDEESMLYQIEHKDYAGLIREVHKNRVLGITSETYEECYGAVDYFVAAAYYKAYSQNGRETEAAEQARRMEGSKVRMGELSYLTKEIDQMLEVE